MAETSGPFDPVNPADPQPNEVLTEDNWELLVKHVCDGVVGAPGSTGLNAFTTGTRGVAVTAGTALIRGRWYKNDANKVLTSPANASGSSRIDRAVLRLDRAANTVTTELLQGSPGAGPPALTDNATVTEAPLWQWTITPGAISASGLSGQRQWIGSIVRPCTSTNRPLNPQHGQLAYETDTGRWIGFTGSDWIPLLEDTGDVSVTLGPKWRPDGSNLARKAGSWVNIDLNLLFGEAVNEVIFKANVSNLLVGSVPAAFRPPRNKYCVAGLSGGGQVRLQCQPDGKITAWHASENLDFNQSMRATFAFLA